MLARLETFAAIPRSCRKLLFVYLFAKSLASTVKEVIEYFFEVAAHIAS